MAITLLDDEAVEQSTFGIQVDFTDEAGSELTPNEGTIEWTLTDADGTVINSREQEAVASASTITVTLSGDDLQILEAEASEETVYRVFTVEAEYNSDLGNNLPLRDACGFSKSRNARQAPDKPQGQQKIERDQEPSQSQEQTRQRTRRRRGETCRRHLRQTRQ